MRDEFSYAERFGLAWPKIRSEQLSPGLCALGGRSTRAGEPKSDPAAFLQDFSKPGLCLGGGGRHRDFDTNLDSAPRSANGGASKEHAGPNIQMEHRGLGRRVARAHLERQWEHRDCGSYQWPCHDRRKLRESAAWSLTGHVPPAQVQSRQ